MTPFTCTLEDLEHSVGACRAEQWMRSFPQEDGGKIYIRVEQVVDAGFKVYMSHETAPVPVQHDDAEFHTRVISIRGLSTIKIDSAKTLARALEAVLGAARIAGWWEEEG